MIPSDAISLSFERIFCSRHGEPLRADWPKGYPVISVLLFQAAVDEDTTFTPKTAEALLDDTPACCRVDDETMLRLYKEARFGVKAWCSVCKLNKRLGAPYSTTAGKKKHVCFNCVVFCMEPMH